MADQAVENILIFKSPDDDWGEFSNQFPAPCTYMGIRFETVEQFLYYMRAVFGRSKTTAEKVLRAHGDKSWCEKFRRDNTPPYLRDYINHPDPKERQYAPYSLEPFNVDEWNHPKAYGCVVLPIEN